MIQAYPVLEKTLGVRLIYRLGKLESEIKRHGRKLERVRKTGVSFNDIRDIQKDMERLWSS